MAAQKIDDSHHYNRELRAALNRGELNWTVISEPFSAPLQKDWGIEGYPSVYIIDDQGTLHPEMHMCYYGAGGYDTKEVVDKLDELFAREIQQ